MPNGVRLWAEIPPQHRATEELLRVLDFPGYLDGGRFCQYSRRRYTEGLPDGEPQCAAVLKAVRCNWDSQWAKTQPPPDPRFTTRMYVKQYLRCPFRPHNGAALCPMHGGPKREVFPAITIGVRFTGAVGLSDLSQPTK